MEDQKAPEIEIEGGEPAPTPEPTPEPEPEKEPEHIDHKAELEKLKANDTTPESKYSEEEKAKRALYFNAERAKELGIDPAEVLGIKPQDTSKTDDPRSIIREELAERDARALAESEEEFQHMKYYMDRGLSVEDAHILANKGKLKRSIDEAKRGSVQFAKLPPTHRVERQDVPERSAEEQAVLQRRGLQFNPKTGTWQGRFTEEYWDQSEGRWVSRKLKR